MDEPLWDGWARWYWRWRWDRHIAWLQRESERAQERSYRVGGYGEPCPCPECFSSPRPGALLAVHLRDLARVEEEMRLVILHE